MRSSRSPESGQTPRRLRVGRGILFAVVVGALVSAAILVHVPTVDELRSWASSFGPWFPVAFFLVHAVVTIAPIPRTLFTISAGVLFGPVVGIALAVGATTVSAILAFLLVRAIGRDLVAPRLTHPALASIDRRLARRGWLAVGSLRLIAPVPFAVVNYTAGVSAVRVVPFTVATAVGVVPGTVGVVLLGNALGGHSDPVLLAVSALCIAVGVIGLILDARQPVVDVVRTPQAAELDIPESSSQP